MSSTLTHLSPNRPHGHARSRSLSISRKCFDKTATQTSDITRKTDELTPPASRRSSESIAPEVASSSPHTPPRSLQGLPKGDSFSIAMEDSPASRSKSRSRSHQRSRSVCLLPGDIEFSVPNYARSTERSRSRMAHVNPHDTNHKAGSSTATTPEPTASPSVFSATYPSANVLRINASSAFRLEIRIIATDTVELVAVPVVPQVETASYSSSSSLASVGSIPDAQIPELNISTPVELSTIGTPVLLAVQPPSPSNMDIPAEECLEKASPFLPPSPVSPPPPPPPRTAEEHLDALRSFVEKRQLSNFFATGSNDSEEFLVNVSRKAAELIKKLGEGSDTDAQNSFLAKPETVAEVVKLSLYDHILFCGEL